MFFFITFIYLICVEMPFLYTSESERRIIVVVRRLLILCPAPRKMRLCCTPLRNIFPRCLFCLRASHYRKIFIQVPGCVNIDGREQFYYWEIGFLKGLGLNFSYYSALKLVAVVNFWTLYVLTDGDFFYNLYFVIDRKYYSIKLKTKQSDSKLTQK
jgi:hypothetical protein